jgi:hypothetical protein
MSHKGPAGRTARHLKPVQGGAPVTLGNLASPADVGVSHPRSSDSFEILVVGK